MKKLLSLVFFGLILSKQTFGAIRQPDTSDLQVAIDKLAYPKKQTYDEFLKDILGRYNALQRDLIEMQHQAPESEKENINLFIKLINTILSDSDSLKMSYILSEQKINSIEDITPELVELIQKAFQKIPFLQEYNYLAEKEQLFASLKFQQQQRELFYAVLLTKPEVKREYDDIVSGEKSEVSDNFIKEIAISALSRTDQCKELVLKQMDGASEKCKAIYLEMLHELDQEVNTEKILNSIMLKFQMIKPFIPLIIKHFGNIGVFGY